MTDVTHDDSDVPSVRPRARDLPRAVWVLVATRAVNRLGAFTLPFLAVVLVAELGATVTQAGYVVAAFGLATIPSRVAGGVLADRLGRVPTIGVGLVGCALAQVWIAASPSLASAALGVVALGLAFELYEPPSQALVADLTDDDQRPVAYGLLSASLAAAGAAAGLLAAWLGGFDLRWLLVADAVSCLVAAALVAALVREPRRPASGGAAPAVTAGPWRDPRLLAMLAAGTVFALLYMAMVIALPLTLAARGLRPEHAGVVLTVSAVTVVAAQPLLRWRRLGDGFGALRIGYVVLAAGLAGTGLAASLPAFLLAAVVWSVGDLLLMGHAWTIVSRLAPPASRGSYLAAYGLSWGFATVLAPLVGTQLLGRGGPVLLWSALAALSIGLALVQPGLSRVCSSSTLTPCALSRSSR